MGHRSHSNHADVRSTGLLVILVMSFSGPTRHPGRRIVQLEPQIILVSYQDDANLSKYPPLHAVPFAFSSSSRAIPDLMD